MNKKIVGGIVVLVLLVLIIAVASSGSGSNTQSQSPLNVSNISVTSQGYGMYNVNTKVVPNKDFSYLEMAVIFYDSDGAVVGTSPLVWNVNDAKQGQTYKVQGSATANTGSTPKKATVFFFDSAFSGGDTSSAIWAQNVTLKD
jgi:hypothetical protein